MAVSAKRWAFGFGVVLLAAASSAWGADRAPFFVELDTPCLAELWAAGKAADAAEAAGHLAQIEAEQQRLLDALAAKSINATVVYRVQRVLNGAAIYASPHDRAAIAALHGVKRVRPMPPQTIDNAGAAPFVGTPALWEALGLTGQTIRLGIIDTGIDYIHVNFGGSGLQQDYDANDRSVLGDVPFPTAKVVGGWDFAGTDYNAADPEFNTPSPDPDPMDHEGHGSHVAGTAGGFGVTAEGAAYAGGYGAPIDFEGMRIGPGMAPEASLYALKVFGDYRGSTMLSPQALEWAVDPDGDGDPSDHLDVVNLSLGGGYGNSDPEDPYVQAANNTAAAGVVVVCSAGNSGDTHFVTDSPGSAGAVVSVAASVDDNVQLDAFSVNAPEDIAGEYVMKPAGFGPGLTEVGVTGDVAYAAPADGCTAFENAGAVAGHIALIDRGACNFIDKVRFAESAGALAAIVANNADGDLISMSGDGTEPGIPSVFISREDGLVLKDALSRGAVNVTLSSAQSFVQTDLADTLADFTSRGPSWTVQGPVLKPDVSAPGYNIFSTKTDTGNEGTFSSGTSMASPVVAGVMCLLCEQHPDWTPAALKALLMNTAAHDLYQGADFTPPRFAPPRAGAGCIDAALASANQVIAYDAAAPERVSVSFPIYEAAGAQQVDALVRVENRGAETAVFDVSVDTIADMPGAAFSLPDGAEVSVAAGGAADVAVRLSLDPAAMRHARAATMAAFQGEEERHWISEESGLLLLTPRAGGVALRVPLYAAPRPASTMTAVQNAITLTPGATGTAQVDLAGTGLALGGAAADAVHSRVSAFELQAVSPLNGDIPDYRKMFDLAYVGVATDYAGPAETPMLYFGVAAHGDWASPSVFEADIEFDLDANGETDYVAFTVNSAWWNHGDPTDVYVCIVYDVAEDAFAQVGYVNALTPSEACTNVLMNNVMIIPVPLDAVGLDQGQTAFDYRVGLFDPGEAYPGDEGGMALYGYDPVDAATDWLSYDAAAPGLDFARGAAGPPLFDDQDGAALVFDYDTQALVDNNPLSTIFGNLGVLLLHHHNAAGARAEVVPIEGLRPVLSAAPLTQTVSSAPGRASFDVSLEGLLPLSWQATVLSGTGWLSIYSGQTGSGVGVLEVAYAANHADAARTGTVELRAEGAENSPITLTIVQRALQNYTLTTAVRGAGAITPAPGSHVYQEGSAVALTATPEEGWRFVRWEGPALEPNAAITTVTMNADATVTAVFEEIGGWGCFGFLGAAKASGGPARYDAGGPLLLTLAALAFAARTSGRAMPREIA